MGTDLGLAAGVNENGPMPFDMFDSDFWASFMDNLAHRRAAAARVQRRLN